MRLEIEQETDGRWLAEAPELPGVMAYGETREAAVAQVEALVLRVLELNGPEHHGVIPDSLQG